MAGFSQDLPTISPQSMLQRLNTTSTTSSSSSSEMDIMRNRILQMQALAINEKEVYIILFIF
jgi:phage shock protein A